MLFCLFNTIIITTFYCLICCVKHCANGVLFVQHCYYQLACGNRGAAAHGCCAYNTCLARCCNKIAPPKKAREIQEVLELEEKAGYGGFCACSLDRLDNGEMPRQSWPEKDKSKKCVFLNPGYFPYFHA